MPSVSEKQRRFFGAELARKRAGKKTRTGLSEAKLKEYASKVKAHSPESYGWNIGSRLPMKTGGPVYQPPMGGSGSERQPAEVAKKDIMKSPYYKGVKEVGESAVSPYNPKTSHKIPDDVETFNRLP